MGGFGAICYAEKLNLKSVLALSPQYTISESFDKRWKQHDESITWHHSAEMGVNYDGVIHLVYDPFDMDARQAELICDNFTEATIFCHEIKSGSHPTALYFNDSGALKKLLLSFASDNFEIPIIEKKNTNIFKATQ